MKTFIKIFLLAVAICCAVGGVMWFYNSIITPPQKVKTTNQYVKATDEDIAHIKDVSTINGLDSIYVIITEEIRFQRAEGFLTNAQHDKALEQFAAEFIPPYGKLCNAEFQKSVWNEPLLNIMKRRAGELLALRLSDNTTKVCNDSLKKELNYISQTVTYYYEAKKVTAAGGYHGLEWARTRKDEAERYKRISPINNCTSLMERLRKVPERLEQAHYAYLNRRVAELRNRSRYSRDEFNNLYASISKEIKGYKDLYHKNSKADALKDRADEYFKATPF